MNLIGSPSKKKEKLIRGDKSHVRLVYRAELKQKLAPYNKEGKKVQHLTFPNRQNLQPDIKNTNLNGFYVPGPKGAVSKAIWNAFPSEGA